MTEVTKERFYAAMMPRDVHPRPQREYTDWETPARQLLGRSYPGYAWEGVRPPSRYYLAPAVARLAESLATAPRD